jgi:kynureninase
LIEQIGSKKFSLITPSDPSARGAQLSIQAKEHPKRLHEELIAAGVKCDFREPNVIRVAPTPLYNTFHEVWRFAQILAAHK